MRRRLPTADAEESLLNDAETILSTGDDERALHVLRYAVKKYPNSARAHYELAKALFHAETINESVAELNKALAIDPNFAKAHYQLGVYYLASEKLSESEIELEKARALEPTNKYYRAKLADVLEALGKKDDPRLKAFTDFVMTESQLPHHPRTWKEMTFAHADRQDWLRAKDCAIRWVEESPNTVDGHLMEAWCTLRAGEPGDARTALEPALQLDPNNYDALLVLGLSYMESGRYKEAEETFAKAVSQEPDELAGQLNLAVAQSANSKTTEAKELLKKVSTSKAPPVMALLALEDAKFGDYEHAQTEAVRILAENPDDFLPLIIMSIVDKRKGDNPGRLQLLNQAVTKAPKNPLVLTELADAQFLAGSYKESAETAQLALQIGPGNVKAKHTLALSLGKLGNWDGAVLYLQEALGRRRNDVALMCDLAFAKEQKGDKDGAELLYKKILATDKTCPNAIAGLSRLKNKH